MVRKNFVALFEDPGAAFVPDKLTYTLSGVSTGIQQMLFQKRDGRFYLALWQSVLSSSLTSSDSGIRDVEPARRPLTLNLGTKIASARIYEPSFSASPVRSYADSAGIGSIALSVPDHVQVIEMVPLGCSV